MLNNLIGRVGPQNYICQVGVLDSLADLVLEQGVKRVLIVHGTKGWAKARPYLDNFYSSDIEIEEVLFGGESSYQEVARLEKLATHLEVGMIIGVGGGKLMDTVKFAGSNVGVKFATIPTLASNCAPWSAISIMYHENGMAEGGMPKLPNQVSLLLIEPRIILDSPVDYFIAGLADTLAKWYESDLILGLEKSQKEPMLTMARAAAKTCHNTILGESKQAIKDMQEGKLSDEFVAMVEVIIAIAGMVGGIGDSYGRTTAAHTIHDAISVYRPEVLNILHGNKVAYGIFFQLALEEKWNEIDRLVPFYEELKLPKTLKDMGIEEFSDEDLEVLVEYMMNPREDIHFLPIKITRQLLRQSISNLEAKFA